MSGAVLQKQTECAQVAQNASIAALQSCLDRTERVDLMSEVASESAVVRRHASSAVVPAAPNALGDAEAVVRSQSSKLPRPSQTAATASELAPSSKPVPAEAARSSIALPRPPPSVKSEVRSRRSSGLRSEVRSSRSSGLRSSADRASGVPSSAVSARTKRPSGFASASELAAEASEAIGLQDILSSETDGSAPTPMEARSGRSIESVTNLLPPRTASKTKTNGRRRRAQERRGVSTVAEADEEEEEEEEADEGSELTEED